MAEGKLSALSASPAWEAPTSTWRADREAHFQRALLHEIVSGPEQQTLWVTGPAGGGLSTELAATAEELARRGLFPVRASLLGRLTPALDSGPTSAFLLLLFWVLRAFPSEGITDVSIGKMEAPLLRLVEHLRGTIHLPQITARQHWSGLLGQTLYVAAGLLRDPKWRAQLEEDPALRPAGTVDLVSALLERLAQVVSRRVVLLVDDTNRMDLHLNADRVLTESAALWRSLPGTVVLAYPRRLELGAAFPHVLGTSRRVSLESVSLAAAPAFLSALIARRAPELPLDARHVAWATSQSLGNPAEFLRLVLDAAQLAHARGVAIDEALEREVEERRAWELVSRLGDEQRALLIEIERSGRLPTEHPAWLAARLVLEQGGPTRARVHPSVARLLGVT
ncbi:MAG: hypothetical protein KIT72_02260 [Polyangiaceae bacterium]|nr:hypothetical protein [Polyangiaceae bacterium]MCW5789221.1 hypothetical protein [Polyangiaceae bacterium]